MRFSNNKTARLLTGLAASLLLLAHKPAAAQTVNLTAGATTTTLPDGQTVPMWGYTCGTASGALCSATNPATTGWSPIVITVPYTADGSGNSTTSLSITLTNSLSFTAGSATNNIPTSLVISGQLGGGLGAGGVTAASPLHNPQGVTWPTPGAADTSITVTNAGTGYTTVPTVTILPGTGDTTGSGATAVATVDFATNTISSITLTNAGSGYTADPIVQISAPNVSGGTQATATLTLANVQAGPAPTGLPPAQLPRVQSFGTEVAAGGSATLTWAGLRPGTYLLESGTHPAIQVPMGLYGVVVVTPAGSAYPASGGQPLTAAASTFDDQLALVLSEIDPVQNASVDAAVRTAGFSETRPWSGLAPNGCGYPGSSGSPNSNYNTCYPPTVNYSARYYLVNGVSFDRTNVAGSTLKVLGTSAGTTASTNNLLLRLVNAGLAMHVPSMVNKTMTLIAEDGNPLPGVPRVQNEVFMPAGKTYDVLVQPSQTTKGTYDSATLALFDRHLSLSTNNQRDGGMQTYIAIAGGATSGVGTQAGSQRALTGAGSKTFFCVAGQTLSVSDPLRGLLGGTTGANGVAVVGTPTLPAGSTLNVQSNGTFTYTPPSSGACGGAFTFVVNNNTASPFTATISECDAGNSAATGCNLTGNPIANGDSYTANNQKKLEINAPGVLTNDTDPGKRPLTVDVTSVPSASSVGLNTLVVQPDGSFVATAPSPGTYTFTYQAVNSQKSSSSAATVTLTFPPGSGLVVNLWDQKHPNDAGWQIKDYRWIIEEDRTFWVDPKCQVNVSPRPLDSYGRTCPDLPVEALGYSFHTGGVPVVATGCVGDVSCESGQTVQNTPAVCDAGGICRTDASRREDVLPSDVVLDPNKHYFISIMPGDGINPTVAGVGGPVTDSSGRTRPFDPALDCPNATDFTPGTGSCGHNMGGAQIAPQFDAAHNKLTPTVNIQLTQTPLPTARIAVLVYEDDYPLNGENDAGGGVDILAPNEPGLGSFQVVLLDQAGGLGDATGQITYDMFNMPVSNGLAGTVDPMTGLNACPITSNPDGIVGMIITCPTYESDGKTLSPIAGQAVINNLYPGLYEVQAFPSADREARGEVWLQTNTLDGGKPHEAFIRPGEPSYFQEFGPGGFHVQIGFANPNIINARRTNSAGTGMCDTPPAGGGLNCSVTITGHVHGNHMSRTPDERTYDSGSYDAFAFSNCYVSLGYPDQQDFAFANCDADGNFTMTGIPPGTYKVAVFDQWNDIMLDGLITSVTVGTQPTQDITLTVTQWRTNLYTRIYLDTLNGKSNGIPDRDANGNDLELGLPLVPINIRYRDGSKGFANNTDLNGYATYNEVFPIMNWLVVEPDQTRFKPTGEHVIYDAGGPVATSCSDPTNPSCSTAAANLAGTVENNSLPVELRVPGAVYCVDPDCSTSGDSIALGAFYTRSTDTSANAGKTTGLSSGRIDPPWKTEGWQGLLGQHSFIDFGMKPFQQGENGGIQGMVIYSSTRPFDDPTLGLQLQWEPGVPNVTVNLYQKGVAADGTPTLTLVDTTQSTSWDSWAQGFRIDPVTGQPVAATGSSGYVPNMNCPGQDPTSGFFATLQGSTMWLDQKVDANGMLIYGAPKTKIAYNSQFKCFDGWAMLNQIQPAPYDGKYQFPSTVGTNAVTGRPAGVGHLNGVATPLAGTNCSICVANPDDGTPMLPAGTYVVEVVPPAGFEIVKEEDKNILMGDIYIAAVTQQFAGLGNVFILPDQAAINSYYNPNNPLNATTNLGVVNPREDFASNNQMWPCAGQVRVVPDTMSLFPTVGQTAPFAQASRPLCDRKEVGLRDQMTVTASFFVFTKNHIAGHFTGVMTNDMASEFDPFSPQFGEKFGPPNLPVDMRDFMGSEVTRVYADQWGVYNGMYMSSWEVNPPNPTGFAPQMSISCMNDPGPVLDRDPGSKTFGQMITDPAYNPAYSNFCYEMPFMPGFTAYMDTPVVPVQAFADRYNLPDAEYPDGTPVIKRADFTGTGYVGPWSQATAGVSAVNVTNSGSGYTAVPTVSFTGGSGSGAAGTAVMGVSTINVGAAGTLSTTPPVTPPTVTLTGGGGAGATATACIGVASLNLTAQGTGYNRGATVTIGAPPAGGARATATAQVSGGRVTGLTLTNKGCGYTSAPSVTIAPGFFGGGSGATATAAAGLASVQVTAAGTGYTSSPTVAFNGGSLSGESATATLGVRSVNVTSPGTGYTAAPSVAFSGGGGAAATAAISVTAAHPLVLQAFGQRVVQNPQYTGPSGLAAPYNQKTVTRTYTFGPYCAPGDVGTVVGCVTASTVTVDGKPATINPADWTDSQITLSLPSGLNKCPVQQTRTLSSQATPPASYCGQVVITKGSGQQSFDAITVTVGGTTPIVVEPDCTASKNGCSTQFGEFYANPLQTAIDKANPGDLIIVDAGTYRENVIMWKPVRLQGVGAGSVTINADAHPAGKMDAWRRRVDCMFGLTLAGAPNPGNTQFDPSGQFTCPAGMYFRVDRLPFEGFLGWDASSNGNLAQVLQEPSLMGAYEGAGVTVVGRGVNQTGSGNTDMWGVVGGAGTFADGSRYVNATSDCGRGSTGSTFSDYSTSNFLCNPSSIDGLSIINSSQGGGGIFMHGWNSNMQIANNRISANAGTLSGAINLGNGEVPPAFAADNTICAAAGSPPPATPAPLCPPMTPNAQLPNVPPVVLNGVIPMQFNTNVHVHHNQVIDNASIGDALFSGTPAGAGGVTISAGSDNYELDHNWIAGNLTSSDGAGVAHMGASFNGNIHHNVVLFNEANNPTLPVDGGGIIIMGAQEDRTLPSTGLECGGTNDLDCPPGMGDGTGPGLRIDSNLILGNSAAYGSGGGLRLRQTNGTEVAAFPTAPQRWYDITVTNNIIANNVAGWDGAGVSLQDSFKTSFINNTVASNDTTASAGVLFKTLGAIDAASPPPGCLPTPDPMQPQNPNCLETNAPHIPQPAGLVTMQNTPNMISQITAGTVCPTGFGYGNAADSTATRTNGRCVLIGLPKMVNDLFWQNRAFHVEIVDANGNPISGTSTPNGTGLRSQQNIVALLPELNQTATGQCVSPAGMTNSDGSPLELYWDVGVRMDEGPQITRHLLNFDQTTVGNGGYATGQGGSGARANTADVGLISLTAVNSIFSDAVNQGGVLVPTGGTNYVPPSGNMVVNNQYCNGARTPPEQCSANQGANAPEQCHGYFAPAGQSETAGVKGVFVFNNISATATVDEGQNWINMAYGPLTLGRPPSNGTTTASAEPLVAGPALAKTAGAYTIPAGSAAIGTGAGAGSNGVPTTDYFGQARSASAATIGAVEYPAAAPTLTSIDPVSGMAGTTAAVTLTGTNFLQFNDTISVSGTGVTVQNVTANAAGTQLSASFVIAGNAATTARNVTVTTAGGATSAVTFTVTPPPPPTLTSVSPSTVIRGTNALTPNTVQIALTGTNLNGVSIAAGTGITCTPVAGGTATSLNASCSIASSAPTGAHNLTVSNAGGTSNVLTLNVSAPPSLSGLGFPGLVARNSVTTRTFTYTNSTPSSVKVGALSLTAVPLATNAFAITGGTCSAAPTLAPNGTCTIVVTLTALNRAALYGATLNAASTTAGVPTATLVLASASL